MSEYITAWLDYIDMSHVREKIVRCKDCANCNEHPVCGKFVLFCHHFSMCDSAGFPVEPDGYCKWGVAKDGA